MPPGSTNPTNSTTLISNLNPEEITDLPSKFEACRKTLACPHCAKRGVFRRNGSTKTEPPQPIFRCSGCGFSFRAATMRPIVLSSLSTSLQLSPMEENCEISRTSTETPTPHTEDLQTLLNMVHRLTNELAAARAEIEQLRATILQLQGQLNKENLPSSQHATSSTTNTQYSIDFPDLTSASPPWRNPGQVRRIKENLMQEQQQRRQQRQEAAARLLQSPSENQGFQYLYLPTKARVPIGQLRSRLRKFDINNDHILDIHYPDRNVVALLVHNDYANELRSQLKRFKITLKDNFDPCDPKILRDPKYVDATEEERANLAFMHHCNRMEHALKFIRAPVKFAVARYFYTKGWISKQTLDETLLNRRTSQMEADPLFFEDERMSVTDDCQLSQSHTMEPHVKDGSPL